MKNILSKYEDIALSDKEVLKLVNGRANLILYPELHKYKTLDQILEPYGACILLYESKPKFGHWCCIFKVNDNLVEYFNPYGGPPDNSLEHISINFRLISNQYHPHLSYLMYNSNYQLSYNEYNFQKYGRDIKTCGRWVCIRLLFRDYSLHYFHKLINIMKKELNMTGDKLVTFLTMYINK